LQLSYIFMYVNIEVVVDIEIMTKMLYFEKRIVCCKSRFYIMFFNYEAIGAARSFTMESLSNRFLLCYSLTQNPRMNHPSSG